MIVKLNELDLTHLFTKGSRLNIEVLEGLPYHATLINMQYDITRHEFTLLYESPLFPEVKAGEPYPHLTVSWKAHPKEQNLELHLATLDAIADELTRRQSTSEETFVFASFGDEDIGKEVPLKRTAMCAKNATRTLNLLSEHLKAIAPRYRDGRYPPVSEPKKINKKAKRLPVSSEEPIFDESGNYLYTNKSHR